MDSPLHLPRALGTLLFVLCGLGPVLEAQIPAFPGAEGAGAYAVGGRNGDVYHVTNLNASGAGSLAYGLTTSVPTAGRTIIFDVSGYANISGTLRITNNKITVAGQTAPGDGFALKNGTFLVSADDIIVRHLRFRDGNSADSINLDSNSVRTIFDHIDAMFANDENFSSFNSPPDDMTFQWSMNAWGMEDHSCGGLWDQNHATSHHSLWGHQKTRNPKARPQALDWINNVTFDWDIGFILADSDTPETWNSNVIANYFISTSSKTKALEKGGRDRNGAWNFHLYLLNNRMDGNVNGLLDGTDTDYGMVSGDVEHLTAQGPNHGIPVTVDDPLTAYKKIVSAAGPLRLDYPASKPLRDEVNTLLVSDLLAQKKRRVSSVAGTGLANGGFGTLSSAAAPADSDRDGIPDAWETALGWNSVVDDHTTALASSGGVLTGATFFPPNTPAGYTRLEEYLHFLAIPHATLPKSTTAQPSAIDIDLRKFTSGFASAPVFTLTNVTGGGATPSGPGGCLVHFVPTTTATGVPGRAGFTFTVTDSAGAAWTQQLGIFVSPNSVPRDLTWAGDGASNVWDASNQLWRLNGSPATYGGGDNTVFDDAGSNAPNVTLSGPLSPSSLVVNAAKDYTFSGSGSLSGGATLTKQGPGRLTIANTTANTFSGGVQLQDGEIVVANGSSLGTGILEFQDTVVTSGYTATNTFTMGNTLQVDAGATGTVKMSARMTVGGAAGGGTLNLLVPGTTAEFEKLNGTWSTFTGTLNITGTASGALLSIWKNGGNFDDLSKATVNLDNVNLGGRDGSSGHTLTIGTLTGTATARLGGAHYAGPLTYSVGGLNKSSTYAGSITDSTVSTASASGSATVFTKTGSGTLTLTGPHTHTGTTTVSGGTLVVSGTLNGPLSVGAATISPSGPGVAGVLTASGVTLAGSTMVFDLSGNPASGNDRITTAGTGALSGTLLFKLNLLDGQLGAGSYELVKTTGALNANANTVLTSSLPTSGTRQTFAVTRPPSGTTNSAVTLSVTGTAADLLWNGTNDATWSLTTTSNWLNGAGSDRFFNLDKVTFDDTSTVGGVTLSGAVQPRQIVVNNDATAYTLGGGSFDGSGSLLKSGPGLLTLTSAHGFTGGTTVSSGTISVAVGGALGSGLVTLGGGTLRFGASDLTVGNALKITAASQLTVTGGNNTLGGAVTGSAPLTLNTGIGLFTVTGNLGAYSGALSVNGRLRFNQGTNPWGAASAAFDLGAVGELSNFAAGNVTIALGALAGGNGTFLRGSDQAGTFVSTYLIGAANLETIFAGAIVNGTTQPVALIKTGSALLTLSGTSTYSGSTTVEEGTLRLTGSIQSASAVIVLPAAALQLYGGTILADLSVASGAGFSGYGRIDGDFNNDGSATIPVGQELVVSGDLVNNGTLVNRGTLRLTKGSQLISTLGSVVNYGVLDLITGARTLPANFTNLGTVLDSTAVHTESVTKAGSLFSVTVTGYPGHTYQLERSVSINATAWQPIGAVQTVPAAAAAPVPLTFQDGSATDIQGFYRVTIGP